MFDLERYNSIDEKFSEITKPLRPLYYVNPVNAKEQKKAFLSREIKNPTFRYRQLEYDPEEVEKNLRSIEMPDDLIGTLFSIKQENALWTNRIMLELGNIIMFRFVTSEINGEPDQALVDYGDKLLKEIPAIEEPKTVPSNIIKDSLEKTLLDNGLTDWKVEFSDKHITTVYQALKKITVCEDRYFTEIDISRLGVHEVGVHALRAANGYEQPFKIFALGLPGYTSTEEGIAMFMEELTGNTSNELMRDYAGRVIAVDSVCKDLSFRQTFDRLKSYEMSDDQAWNLSLRAHRGGGYIKDHLYLKGKLEVDEFAKTDADFKSLYVGKVGIQDLPLVRKLLDQGTLKQPKYFPKILELEKRVD